VTGVESVSSVSADRGVSVAVADDGDAYLGVEFGAAENGTATLTVTNRVSTETLDVTVEDGDTTELQTLGPGEFAEFDVTCGEEVHVSAVGPTTEIDATRSVDCPETVSEDGDEDSEAGDANDGDEDSEADDDAEDDSEDEADGSEDDDSGDAGSGGDDEEADEDDNDDNDD
jgi:hypothetical protein